MERKRFTAEYKLWVLKNAEELKGAVRGKLADFLKSQGLRTSHLAAWRKRIAAGKDPQGKRGPKGDSRSGLAPEMRKLKHRLRAAEKRALRAEGIVLLQMKYVKAAALKLERKDQGLLSQLIHHLEHGSTVSSICEALCVTRRDFYRTIAPGTPMEEGITKVGA
jgi:hypothetical protein